MAKKTPKTAGELQTPASTTSTTAPLAVTPIEGVDVAPVPPAAEPIPTAPAEPVPGDLAAQRLEATRADEMAMALGAARELGAAAGVLVGVVLDLVLPRVVPNAAPLTAEEKQRLGEAWGPLIAHYLPDELTPIQLLWINAGMATVGVVLPRVMAAKESPAAAEPQTPPA